MPTLMLDLTPQPAALGAQRMPQVCYALLTVAAADRDIARPINWAFVADASRSMRIPIVDEAQFRALIRENGAQEALVDGVPVWQLATPVPPEIRAVAKSALDHVAHALHTILERLDGEDRFALIACAEQALVLSRSASGSERAMLAQGIAQISRLDLGDETDLSVGIASALDELERGRDGLRADRLVLLTDGFTRAPEDCRALVVEAAAQGVAVTTVGLGGEFQAELLTELADLSGGRALFLPQANEIAQAISAELAAARAVLTRGLTLALAPQAGATIRRVTRVHPTLSVLFEGGQPDIPHTLRPGDLAGGETLALLVELVVPAEAASRIPLLHARVSARQTVPVEAELVGRRYAAAPPLAPPLREATARANVARLQQRAQAAAQAGDTVTAMRLLAAAAAQLDDLGATGLARALRAQADVLATSGAADALAAKELLYATRRLGGA